MKPTRARRVRTATLVLWSVAGVSVPAFAADTIQWKTIGPGAGGNMLNVAVNPVNPSIVLMESDVGGVLYSGDGGQSWQLKTYAALHPDSPSDYGAGRNLGFGFDPTAQANGQIVYTGALKSTDGGQTWNRYVSKGVYANYGVYAGGGVVDPSAPGVVYAFGASGRVYRTSDGWMSTSCMTQSGTSCSQTDPVGGTCQLGDPCYQLTTIPNGPTVNALVLDPSTGNTMKLLACTDGGIYVSTDGAQTWNPLSAQPVTGAACDNLVLHYDSTTHAKTLYAALHTLPKTGPIHPFSENNTWQDIDTWQGGIYKSTSTDWGISSISWSEANGSGTDAAETNLLVDPGFNTAGDATHPATGWYGTGAASLDCGVNHSSGPNGEHCSIKFNGGGSVQADPNIAVTGGSLYKLSAWYIVNNANTGIPVYAKLWYYKDQALTQPVYFPGGAIWNSEEPWAFYVNPDGGLPYSTSGAWRRFEATVRPPDEANYALLMFFTYQSDAVVWVDDVSLKLSHGLAKLSGRGDLPSFVSYAGLAVDPTDANVVYTGTLINTFSGGQNEDVAGVWKTTDGGSNWTNVTRSTWHDNVVDNFVAAPVCGDGVCSGGEWESCDTCPIDCTGAGKPVSPGCCGDGVCNASVEDSTNCWADCPFDPDPNRTSPAEPGYFYSSPNTYYPARGGYYSVWSIGIGSGTTGHQTVYWGAEHMKSCDGGATWKEVSSNLYTGADSPAGTYQARGDTNDVYAYSVVTDFHDGHNWLLYGDDDNRLMVSYNGGKSFSYEGWQWGGFHSGPTTASTLAIGDSATAIVFDPDNWNHLYAGVSNGGTFRFSGGSGGGVVEATYDPNPPSGGIGRWTWTDVGHASFPETNGAIDLVLSGSSTLVAAVYGKGVYRLTSGSGTWTAASSWNPVPACGANSICDKVNRIYKDPYSTRLYVAVGDPYYSGMRPAAGETGVWESTDDGQTWNRVSSVVADSGSGMDRESVTDIVFPAANSVLVSTRCSATTGYACDGDGGIYKGCRWNSTTQQCDTTSSTWLWTKTNMSQLIVTGLAVSPASSSIVYAFAGQMGGSNVLAGQAAGIYKSVDGGTNWTLLTNNGLMNIGFGRLYFSSGDSHKLYASTIGDGVFEGTITCGPVSEGFADGDSDGIADCADSTRDATAEWINHAGSPTGTYAALNGASAPNTNEVLPEDCEQFPCRLDVVWTFPNVTTGVAHTLYVKGYHNTTSGADNFNFSFVAVDNGPCTGAELNYSPTLLTVTATNQTLSDSLGTINKPVVCVKVQDNKQGPSDHQQDTLTLDQVYITW